MVGTWRVCSIVNSLGGGWRGGNQNGKSADGGAVSGESRLKEMKVNGSAATKQGRATKALDSSAEEVAVGTEQEMVGHAGNVVGDNAGAYDFVP